jgi:hypothetical protein
MLPNPETKTPCRVNQELVPNSTVNGKKYSDSLALELDIQKHPLKFIINIVGVGFDT